MKDIYESKLGLITALHTIQEECRNQVSCDNCPLRNADLEGPYGKCGIQYESPNIWEINDVIDWRAFK